MEQRQSSAMWRRQGLRALITISLLWTLVLMFAQELFSWTTDRPDASVLECLVLAVVSIGVLGVSTVLYMTRPGFLRVPDATRLMGVLVRLGISALIVFVASGIIAAVITYAHLLLTGDPDNPQDGLSVVIAAIWYPVMLTPMPATVIAWWWVSRRDRRSEP